MIERICLHCSKKYNKRENLKFCSSDCFHKWSKGKCLNTGKTHFKKGRISMNKIPKKNCIVCGRGFSAYGERRVSGKYCSYKCMGIHRKGLFAKEKNPNWKGGKRHAQGYIQIRIDNHPYASTNGYVFEHRLVMEKYLGRYLKKSEIIHHLNNKKDDNRIENLLLLTHDNPTHPFIKICPHCRKEIYV